MTIRVRQSDLRMFIECKRKFFLSVVSNLRPQGEAVLPRACNTSDIGNMIHEVLRMYYTNELAHDVTQAEIHEICLVHAASNGGYVISEEGTQVGEGWPAGAEVASIVAARYIPWVEFSGHDLRFNAKAVEERMEFEVNGITITGQPDLIMWDEILNEHGILDHKSVASLDALRPGDFQLITYAWLYWKTTGIVAGWAGHNQLKRNKQTAKAKPPFYDRKTITITLEILEQHDRLIDSLTKEIAVFYATVNDDHQLKAPANMNGECSWKCNVKELCDLMHDGDEVWRHVSETYYIQRTDNDL